MLFPTPLCRCALRCGTALVLLALFLPTLTYAQDAPTLVVREDGFMRSEQAVAIAHTDSSATTPPNPDTFDATTTLFFRYVPAGDWTLEDRREELSAIRLQQGDTAVPVSTVRFVDANTAVAAFPRGRLALHEPFTFTNGLGTSRAVQIAERYFPMYGTLTEARAHARAKADTPLVAADTLLPFLDAGPTTASMALYDSTMQTLDSLATAVIARRNDSLETLRAAARPPTAEALDRVAAFRNRLDSTAAALAPYLDAREQAASEVTMLLDAAETLETGSYASFRRTTMQMLSRNSYDDYQMHQTLALLVRMLVDPDAPAYPGMQPDSLHLSRVEAPLFDTYRSELESYGWMDDFEDVLRIVNTNLEEQNVVFQEEVMRNLRLQRPGAPEPYYELAALFNTAGEGDAEAVQTAVDDALAKITDPVLLDHVQRWHMQTGTERLAVDAQAQSALDEGLAQFQAGNLEAARQTMVRASRLAGGSPLVPYYQGQIARAQGDLDAALLYFERAREQSPAYVMPALEAIDTHMQAEAYDRAVAQADSVLAEQPYWLVYYRKAQALLRAEQYTAAQSVIQSRCEPLNDEEPSLYLMLGDVYMGKEQWDGARWAYEQAGRINPENPDFAARMDSLRTTLNERGIDFSAVQPETEEIELSAPPE